MALSTGQRYAIMTIALAACVAVASAGICIAVFSTYIANIQTQFLSEKDAFQSIYDDYVTTHSHTNTDYNTYIYSHSYTNSEYDTLQSTYNNYVATHGYTNGEYWDENWGHSVYKNLAEELQQIVNLQKSQIIVNAETVPQGAGARTLVETFSATYAGYLTISLESTTTNAYVDVEFYFQGQFFKFTKTLGTSGSAMFCVLPARTVYIYVGNSNSFNSPIHTISATYWC